MIDDTIKSIVLETFKISEDRIDEDLSAGDIPEWDSLGHIHLLMAVEKHFKIAFDVGDAIEIESVGDLVEMVERYTKER